MWEKLTVISSVVAVHVALVPLQTMNGLDFQSRPPYSDLEAAGTDWCPANFDLPFFSLGARCEMRVPPCSHVCFSKNMLHVTTSETKRWSFPEPLSRPL